MRIRKFNEELEELEKLDDIVIKAAFVDFIDAGARIGFNGNIFEIGIKLPAKFEKIDSKGIWNWEVVSSDNELRKFISDFDANNNFFRQIENSINKLSDDYPDYKITSNMSIYSIYINIRL